MDFMLPADSLRSRPSQAPKKSERAPSKLLKQGSLLKGRKSKIDDKIKKRMSTRYADISSPTELQGMPMMPSLSTILPGGQIYDEPREGDEDVRDRTGTSEDAKIASEDKKLLSADDFDPDAFLKLKLANSTEAELQSLQASLHNAKDDTASELQRSVFKNYAEFVLISKEISVLENEMLELKDLLSDYKSMPSMLHIPDPTSVSSSSLSTYKRSSVADLRILYFNQMQTLHSSVEGSAKFVPTTPGRHVVAEIENVTSLNAATYKAVGKVKFVILDDAVLVARRRRRAAGAGDGGSTVNEGKLVAERCWPLNDMLVLDTKDSAVMTNVFKIRHGKETHVYRTETQSEKKLLLSQFRQVAEELLAKRRKDREGEHERRKSMWQGGGDRNSVVPPVPEWMADLARKGGDIPGADTDAKVKAENDARFASEWSDDLTVAIALHEWTKAVDLIEQGQNKASINPLLAAKLPTLTNQLVTSLLASLAMPSNRKSTVVSLISLLNRLKAGAAARNTLLEMRSKSIRELTHKIPFEGNIVSYIADLSVVYFTTIKHTADWYLASFKENEVASSFISWAKQEIESYAAIFRKQVYYGGVDPKVVEDATNVTHLQGKKLLQEYGLDFRYLLNDLLIENPKETSLATPAFSLREHRLKYAPASPAILDGMQIEVKSPVGLPPAPPPPTLSAAPPPRRRRSPAPSNEPTRDLPPPIGNSDSLYPPPSAAMYSAGIRSANALNTPLSAASVYTTNDTPQNNLLSPRLPYANRSRTPVSAGQRGNTTPLSAPALAIPVASPLPRRARSPPLSANPAGRDKNDDKSPTGRERPPRSLRGSPAPRSPAPPPPRSANRPGSAAGQRLTPVAAPREGMI